MAATASPASPATLTVTDAYNLMPYDSSLVVLRLNGPQLKALLERSYRNYYYYKYIPGYGGYTDHATCLLDISAGGRIVYRDSYPEPPDGHNVRGLYYRDETLVERQVDFSDAATYYHVSTLNYLVSGACNFSDHGETLWPLSQIERDTGYLPARRRDRLSPGPARAHRPGRGRAAAVSSNRKFPHLSADNHAVRGYRGNFGSGVSIGRAVYGPPLPMAKPTISPEASSH